MKYLLILLCAALHADTLTVSSDPVSVRPGHNQTITAPAFPSELGTLTSVSVAHQFYGQIRPRSGTTAGVGFTFDWPGSYQSTVRKDYAGTIAGQWYSFSLQFSEDVPVNVGCNGRWVLKTATRDTLDVVYSATVTYTYTPGGGYVRRRI